MNRLVHILLWVLGVSATIFLLAFEYVAEQNTTVNNVIVELDQAGNQLFINQEDILQYLEAEDDSIRYRSISAINSTMLEESLENHPFIASAEVFSTLDGLLSVRVKQKEAAARVISTGRHFYLDAEGNPFHISGYGLFQQGINHVSN